MRGLRMFFERLDKRIRKTMRVICIFLSIAVTVLMFTEIVARYFFSHAFRGLPEIYLLLVMWLYMIGAGLASANKSHLRIGILDHLIRNPHGRRLHNIVVTGMTMIITFYFIWWAVGLVLWAFERPQTTPILMLPWLTSQASILVASLLVAAYALRDFIQALTGSGIQEPAEEGNLIGRGE
jgi:TRAP-type C4-dicarboxylate transport system permease small subunit